MKKILTPFFFLIVVNLWSQRLTTSMKFLVNSPSDIAQELVYGYPSDFGPSTIKTVTGDLAKGTNVEEDQSGCTPFTNDLTGKIAIIERGVCNVSLKVYHAQQQGAIGCVIVNSIGTEGVINFIAGDNAGDVVIPSIMISYLDGQSLLSKLESNITTNVSFYVPLLSDGIVSYAYKTPLSQTVEIDSMYVSAKGKISSLTNISLDIVSPLGNKSSYSLSNLALKADEEITFGIPVKYKPSEIGVYTATFTSSLDPNHPIVKKFEITSKTFGLDNDNISKAFPFQPDNFSFKASNYTYGIGAIYYFPNEVKDKGITVSFGLKNVDVYIDESLRIFLYEEPMGGFDAGLGNYDNLTIVGFQSHKITASDQKPGGLIDVKLIDVNTLEEKITLKANKQYNVVVKYEGNGNIETAPGFLHSPKDLFLSYSTTVYTDQLYMNGWNSGEQAVLRLSIEDSNVGLNDKNEGAYSHHIYPNPTTGLIHFGKELEVEVYNNLGNKLFESLSSDIDLSNQAAGVYFLKVESKVYRVVKY